MCPVTVTPFVHSWVTTTYCCGDPAISPGPASCNGTRSGSRRFTITQNIGVEIPIEIGTKDEEQGSTPCSFCHYDAKS